MNGHSVSDINIAKAPVKNHGFLIHSYQPICRTVMQPPGLGDFLRGTAALYQLSRQYRTTLKIDFTSHPLAYCFEQVDSIPKRGKRKVHEFFNQASTRLEPFVANPAGTRPTFVLTNAVPPQMLDDDCRTFICDRLRPTNDLKKHIISLKQQLGLERYCTLHLRMGDHQMEGEPEVPAVVLTWLREQILPAWGKDVLVISDNSKIKKRLARDFGVKVTPGNKPVHLGDYRPQGHADPLLFDTVAEFLLMAESEQIYRFSVYSWGSGFSDICAALYQIPLDIISEPDRGAIMAVKAPEQTAVVHKVLNVGGNSKAIPIPDCYDGWQHDLLDIDPQGNPDVLCDARDLLRLAPRQYDSIYCSHNLEHYHRHDLVKVLKGFRTILKKDGFVYVRVPDLFAVMKRVVGDGLDIDDVLYELPNASILVRDVIFGWELEIERSGNDFFAHKTGFTAKSLKTALENCGFKSVNVWAGCNYELTALAFLTDDNSEKLNTLKEQLKLP